MFDKLKKDKEGCTTLYLIYKYIHKFNFDIVLNTLILIVLQGKAAKGKKRGKGKSKSQSLVLKKVKTKLTNNNFDIKV